MTLIRTYGKPINVGRKKQFETRITLPLEDGVTERIAAVLQPGEVRLDLIREAIERELKRRERSARPSFDAKPKGPSLA